MRRSTTESEEEKQGPAAGYTWILNDTTEQNTYLGIEEKGAGGCRELHFWLCNAPSWFLISGSYVGMQRQEKETTVSSSLIKRQAVVLLHMAKPRE